MRIGLYLALLVGFSILSLPIYSQITNIGTITGAVIDQSNKRPIPAVNVVVHARADSSIVTGVVTDNTGKIDINNIPSGEYYITFGIIGYAAKTSPYFVIDAGHKHVNLGTVALSQADVNLDEVVVSGEKSMFNNSIDRKIYNVDQDLVGKAGSASELLQNIPSVQVDIDGNVTLRGSNVLFLINGKTSPLLDKNSAEVLQQMPANSIEKIEVVSNPSAKYKSEGTAGIINIVQKKNISFGLNGNISANAGNQDRYNGNVRLNYNPGDWNIYGSYSIRRDNRNRINSDVRRQADSSSTVTYFNDNLNSFAHPLSNMLSGGADYKIDEKDQIGLSGNYFYNTFTRTESADKLLWDVNNNLINNYMRDRYDPEYEKEYGFTTYVEHDFPQEDHKLRLDYTFSHSPEQEDNHYTNHYLLPAAGPSFDNTLIQNSDKRSQVTLEYSNPLTDHSTLEAGYSGEFNNSDFNFYGAYFDTGQQQFVTDLTKTNRFLYDESINAAYATYKQSFGAFGFLAGLRVEGTHSHGNLVTLDSIISNEYVNIYPTLHLSYKLSSTAELQLSYSKRTHRPRGEDLNPFPEYRDPRNVQAGNPKLLPEYIHSVEFGCQFQNELMSVLPALFYRYTYNRATTVTRFLNDTTLLTTRENLSNDQSGGVELIVSATVGNLISANWSGNGFYDQIDATNLGYAGRKSIVTWTSAFTFNVNLTKSSRIQINSNYNSARLTPQGEFSPSYVVNTGVRQDLMEGKFSLVFTAADIFKTLKRQLDLNIPQLLQTVTNTRDSRIFYLGFTYHFGTPPKKMKEEQLHYDDNI
jgi:outer membrane receptor protein involved in Fe transport/5-hydroxyisourate hydrolase-like protein (transthyretin family)